MKGRNDAHYDSDRIAVTDYEVDAGFMLPFRTDTFKVVMEGFHLPACFPRAIRKTDAFISAFRYNDCMGTSEARMLGAGLHTSQTRDVCTCAHSLL